MFFCLERRIMPELPEVETVRRGLAPVMQGARFTKVEANRGDLRWPLSRDFARRLEGQKIESLARRGKYLLANLSSGDVLVMHLGMSGSFRVAHSSDPPALGRYYHARPALPAHDHVKFHMSSGAVISFNDPRRFGMMKIVPRADLDKEPQLHALGPEPLADEFNPVALARRCAGKKTSLKAALMDQNIVAGLGNIYVCEALHRRKALAEAPRLHHRDAIGLAERPRASGWSTRSRRYCAPPSSPAVHRCAIIAGPTARSANSSVNFRVYDRAGKPCPTTRLQRHDQTDCADRQIDLLLPHMPKITIRSRVPANGACGLDDGPCCM